MYFRRIGGRSAARANMFNTPLRLHVLRDGAESAVPSSTVPDVTAAPTYVYSRIFTFLSPPHPPHDLFPPLHLVSNYTFYSGTPYLHRHPTPTSDSRSSPRLTYPAIFFPVFLPPFSLFSKRWSLTSNVTPTPTSDSDSSRPLTYPNLFPHLSTTILTFLQVVEPNLHRHPYTNIRFRFLSSPNPP